MTVSDALATAQQFHRGGRLDEADHLYRQVLLANPGHPPTLFLLGLTLHARQRMGEAAAAFAAAAAGDPRHAEARFMLGLVAHQRRQLPAAIGHYRDALAIDPNHARAANNLGRALLDNGDETAALAVLRAVVERHPNHVSGHVNLADALRIGGDRPGAMAAYERAVTVDPASAAAHAGLGAMLAEAGRRTEAVGMLQHAVALDPRSATSHYNLARVLVETADLDQAEAHAARAVDLQPGHADAWRTLGSLHGLAGDVPAAVAAQRRAVEIRPDLAGGQSNVLLSLNYLPELSPEDVADAHRSWARAWADRVSVADAGKPRVYARGSDQPLRVGYVSADFRSHPVATFVGPVLAAHDPAAVDVYCYASVAQPDVTTDRVRATVPHWRDVAALDDATAAELIRSDQIDVLVDLGGHTAANRLGVFARRPAAVQVSWLGYPATTGMAAMDFRITDAIADPPGLTEPFSHRAVAADRRRGVGVPAAGGRAGRVGVAVDCERVRHVRVVQQFAEGDAGGAGDVGGDHGGCAGEPAGAQGGRAGRGGGAGVRRPTPGRGRPGSRPTAAVDDRCDVTPVGLRAGGRGARPVPVQRHDDDVRGAVHGRAGGDARRR